MPQALFELPPAPMLPIIGDERLYPVRRIFCVGRNYAAHAAEMGMSVDRAQPFYFTKSTAALAPSGAAIPYPPGTTNLHHEMELVVAIGAPAVNINDGDAPAVIHGYGCGLDLTRRDVQARLREKSHPWDVAKDFENAAVLSPLTPAAHWGPARDQRITLKVNGETRQDASLAEMIWGVEALIADLSRYYTLGPGDVLFTGTPAGVGALQPGDHIAGGVDGLTPVTAAITDPATPHSAAGA